MRELHTAALQHAHQLYIVVARNADRLPCLHHPHHQPQHIGSRRPAVYQIADERQAPPLWRRYRKPALLALCGVAEFRHQLQQFIQASVHIANNVERPMIIAAIVPKRLPLDHSRVRFFRRTDPEHVPEALALQSAKRSPHLVQLVPHHMRPKLPVGPVRVAVVTQLLRHIEHDRHRKAVILARNFHQRFA